MLYEEGEFMPFYDFHCKHCNTNTTEHLSIEQRDDPTKEPCPHCHTEDSVERVISAPALAMYGSTQLKTTDGFNDRLKEMKRNLPKSGHTQIEKYMK